MMSLLPRYPAPSEIAAGLGKPHAHGDGFMACCPAHDDSNPSLSLSPGKNGLTVWKCFAGCSQADVQDALHGLGLWPNPSSGGPARRQPRPVDWAPDADVSSVSHRNQGTTSPFPGAPSVLASPAAPLAGTGPATAARLAYRHVCFSIYTDAKGIPLHRVERREAIDTDGRKQKQFPQSHWTGSTWAPGVPEATVPFLRLYHLQDIARTAAGGETVWYCEGEKDADRLHALGLVATTNAKAKLTRLDVVPLTGRTVVILVDNDVAGRNIAQEVAARIAPYAASVGILELPNLPDHGDVSDWLDAGTGTLEELLRLGSAAPTWVPPRDDDGSQPDAYVPPFLADADATALFVKGAGEDYKWVTDKQRWLEWDGRRWATVPPEQVRHHAREVIDLDIQVVNREILAINREIQDISHPQSAAIRKQLELLRSTRALLRTRLNWLGKYRSRARLDSMVALTKGDPAITVKASDLDRDRNEVCVGNGVIALRTGVVHPHDRRDLTTRMVMHDGIPARYRPLAGQDMPAAWKDFLWRIQPDPAVRDLLQLIAGAALSGTGAERRIIFMQGPGGAGKGTFMATLMAALGDQESGYAATGDSDVLMTSRNPKDGSGHIAGIARLGGRRLVWLDETADGRTLDRGKLKTLVAGDGGKVVARDLYERGRDTIEIPTGWMMVVTTNDLPTGPGAEDAMWDRLLVVPFDVRIPPGERTDVSAFLKSDPAVLEYVFAWAVEGTVRWHAARDDSGGATRQSGLTLPERVRVATDAWRTRSETSTGAGDALADWLRSDAVMEGDYQESLADLHASHTQWAQSVRAPVLSDRAFAGALRARGIKRVRQSGGNTWNGIGLPDHRPDEDD